jgi:predicted TIM-barrel fold metal-dependent hydrolase
MVEKMRDLGQNQQDRVPRGISVLPEPTPRRRSYLIFSADDHVCESPDMFVSRVPARYLDQAPRLVSEGEDEAWLIDGAIHRWIGGDSTAGRQIDDMDDLVHGLRRDDMRPGTYDIHARIRDMDIDGVYASVTFPSMVWGFCGQKIWGLKDPDLGLACVQAYNDWVYEEWAGPYPGRIIPSSIPYMPDPTRAADEIFRNADRGFKAVHFSENPEKLGLPSINTRHWDPFLRACEETGTAVNLHLGSSSDRPRLSKDTPVTVSWLLWPAHTMAATTEWVYSKVAIRFPDIRIVLSEGGIGWVPLLRERMERSHRVRGEVIQWGEDISPAELLLRNFWFCALDEPMSMESRHHIGVDHIMVEVDYPHSDGIWPDTQGRVHEMLANVAPHEVRLITHENASRVYRHPIPTDPEWAAPAQPGR